MTEYSTFDFGEYSEEQVDQAAVHLLGKTMQSAEAFTQDPSGIEKAGVSDLTLWLVHLEQMVLPMVKVADYLPPEVLEVFRDYLQGFNKRLEQAIAEASKRQGKMN